MKFEELQSIASGIPPVYSDRKYIKKCQYRKSFEIDDEIISISEVKMIEKEDGTITPMMSQRGNVIEDIRFYIPFRGNNDGIYYLTQTKSPLIRSLFRNLPVLSEEKTENGTVTRHLEKIEGKLMFTEKPYKYGDKSLDVVTLEAADE